MNNKLSGAKLVLVEIKRVGRNYIPLVEFLHNRVIKYIDFCPTYYLPGIAGEVGLNYYNQESNMYLTLMNEYGTEEIHREVPLVRYDYMRTMGIRQPIGTKISLQNSFIDCQSEDAVGKVVALMFYYDLPEYSSKNSTNRLITDAISVPLTTYVRYNQLPDVDRLRGKRFRWIGVDLVNVTPDQQTCVNNFDNLFITLRNGTYNIVEDMPLHLFWQLFFLERLEWANIVFDFQNSFITIGGAGTIPNVETDYIGKSVFLNLQYEA